MDLVVAGQAGGNLGGTGLDRPGELGEDQQVTLDRLGDPRPLDLDDHLLPGPQTRPIA